MISDLTPEQVLAANVDAKPVDLETVELNAQIEQAVKGFQFAMKLTAQQVKLLERFASALGMGWKDYLRAQITDKILSTTTNIGSPVITGPSMGKGVKIVGPSNAMVGG